MQKGFAYFKVNYFGTGIWWLCHAIRQMSYLFGAEINEPLEFDLIVGYSNNLLLAAWPSD